MLSQTAGVGPLCLWHRAGVHGEVCMGTEHLFGNFAGASANMKQH